jgi:hypothetical protein
MEAITPLQTWEYCSRQDAKDESEEFHGSETESTVHSGLVKFRWPIRKMASNTFLLGFISSFPTSSILLLSAKVTRTTSTP